MGFPNMFLTFSMIISANAFAAEFPKDLKVTTEVREAKSGLPADQWLAHVGYPVINPAKVTVTVNEKTNTLQIPADSQLISISADGNTALLWKADRRLAFANMSTGEIKNSDLLYADVLKRWEIGDNDPGRRVHLLALHGVGSERDKALFDRRVYYGLLADRFKEDKKIIVYNMDGSLKFSCDFSVISEKYAATADTRYEFVNQAGPELDSAGKSIIDFVINNSSLRGHIDLWSGYFSIQKRNGKLETVASGFCKN